MKRYICLLLIGLVRGCGREDPEPAFPDYLIVPGDIAGYKGSGLLDIQGGLTVHVEGGETKSSATNTISGITGSSDTDQTLINFTDAQPLAYKDSYTVPEQYRSNGQLPDSVKCYLSGSKLEGTSTLFVTTGATDRLLLFRVRLSTSILPRSGFRSIRKG